MRGVKVKYIERMLTVVDCSTKNTGDGEATIEDAVGCVGERDIAKTSSSQVGDCTEHSDCGKAAHARMSG